MTTVKCSLAVALFAIVATAGRPMAGAGNPHSSNFALEHVRVIDGNGGPAKSDQTILVEGGRIRAIVPASAAKLPANVERLNLAGRTVIPGLVGMHEHLFYQIERPGSGELVVNAQSTFAKLYLAAGVTTIRTAGTVDFNGDRRLKQRIDEGTDPGPNVYLSSPYLGAMTAEPDPEGIARLVEQYADAGATSFKAYTSLRATELKAAVTAAHKRGLRVTGHLCAVGFRQAAALGIDNIEHGLPFDTELFSDKRDDQCPDQNAVFAEIARMDIGDSDIRQTIDSLVRHGVAVTSTLAVLESYTGTASAIDARVRPLIAPRLADTYDEAAAARKGPNARNARLFSAVLDKEMAFERAFVAAGGKLLAGVDPTGWGGVVAGFGDQRELELLVEAGFKPEQAIEIATANGASFLDDRDRGSIAQGLRADLVVVRGDPVRAIADIRNVETVFKDGVAYDPAALIAAAQGTLGAFDITQVTWPVVALAGVVLALLVVQFRRRRRRWRGERDAQRTPVESPTRPVVTQQIDVAAQRIDAASPASPGQ
jgi:imidazolonepropionase-like amidohydrolase